MRFVVTKCLQGIIPLMSKSPSPSTGSGRALDPEAKPDDRVDNALRPEKLNDLIGQDQVKDLDGGGHAGGRGHG